MTEIKYTITDELGIHARPAGRLVKEASAFPCAVKIGMYGKMVDAKRIFGVMGLAAKQGDELTMIFEGDNEAAAASALKEFLKCNL